MTLSTVINCLATALLCLTSWSASGYNIRCPGLVMRRMGCFRVLDRWHQPIPEKLFAISHPGSHRGRGGLTLPYIQSLICRCAYMATKRKYDTIGLQRYGECRSGAKARQNFAKYGPSRHCVSYRLRRCSFPNELCVGEDSSNFVFEVRPDSPPVPWPSRPPVFPPWRRPLPTNRRPILPGPGAPGKRPLPPSRNKPGFPLWGRPTIPPGSRPGPPGTRPWLPGREPPFQFPTQKTIYPPRFPTRTQGKSFSAKKQLSAVPLSSWRQPSTIPFPPMYQEDYLISFESDTYVIAIYFVESVVSDSFLDSTPEYRGLKDREETQIKFIYQDDPTFDEVKMINVSESSFQLHNRLRRWTELRRYGRILYGQDYLWPRPLYNGLYQYRYGWQYGGYGLHFDVYRGWHHHAHGWQYSHYDYYFEGPYRRIYGDYGNVWPREELVLSYFELKFKNVGRHLWRLISNVGHWSIALCDKEKLPSKQLPQKAERLPTVFVGFEFPTNAISSLPISTLKTPRVSIPSWREPYPREFPPIYQESYLEYLESTWYLIALYFDEFVMEESFDEGSLEYKDIEKEEERQITEIYQGDSTFEEVQIVNISKTSPELHKRLKKIMEADLYGRPLGGGPYGGNIAYGGVYGGQYSSQFPSTGPYDPYSYEPRNPYGGLYGSQYGGMYGKQGSSTGMYGKQGTNSAKSGKQGTGGNQTKGRAQGSGVVNKIKPKKKKKKKRVLSYFKLKFRNCGAHLKRLVKKVGFGNIARVGALVPQSYAGCCCCCYGSHVKKSLVARSVSVNRLGMPRDVLSKCSCVANI